MMDKALMAVAAAAALAAAAAIGVAAAAFAVYAGLHPWVGPAWAAATMALLVLIGALAMRGRASGGRRRRDEPEPDASLVQKAVEMAREHPLLAVGAAVGVGVYAIRNPQLVAAVVTAFMAGRDEAK